MSEPITVSIPTFRRILGAEFLLYRHHKAFSRNVWLTIVLGQVTLLASFGLLVGLTIQLQGGSPRFLYSLASDLGLEEAPAAVVIGSVLTAFWGFFEAFSWPGGHRYRWSLPADRRTLDLARWVVGAAVTLSVSTLVLVTAVTVSALFGHLGQLAPITPGTWFALWAMPLLPFALASVMAVRAHRSKGPLVGLLLALSLLLPLMTGHGGPSLSALGQTLGAGPLSLANAIVGGVSGVSPELDRFSPAGWPAAFALWLGLAVGSFLALTLRRH